MTNTTSLLFDISYQDIVRTKLSLVVNAAFWARCAAYRGSNYHVAAAKNAEEYAKALGA